MNSLNDGIHEQEHSFAAYHYIKSYFVPCDEQQYLI